MVKSNEKYQWSNKLTNSEFEELINSSVILRYNKDEIIIKQGTLASQILFLEEGMVKLNFEEKGKETTFGFSSNGDFIGLMCSFVKKRLDFSATAITPAIIRIFDRDVMERLIKENGEFAVYIVTMMSELISAAVHSLISLNHRNANGSVAFFLLNLMNFFKNSVITIPFTREEIANTLGYSKESVINVLSALQKDGIIGINGRELEIIDKEALEIIAENG